MTEIEADHAVVSSRDFSKRKMTGGGESHKMEKEIFLHGNGYYENVLSSDDGVSQLSSNIGNLGKENLLYDANKEEETTKAGMLEECIEYEETTMKNEVKETKAAEASSHENDDLQDEKQEKSEAISKELYESKLTKENNLILDKQNRMPSYQRLTQSRYLKTGTNLFGKSGNASPQIQNSLLPKNLPTRTKSAIQSGKEKVLALKNKGNRAEAENVEVTSAASKSPLHKKIGLGSVSTRQNHTVPKPFSLATDKRASFGVQQTGSKVAQNNSRRANISNATSPVAIKIQLTAKSASGVSETKISHSIIHKPPTSTEASKGRTSIATAAVGSISRSNERTQKQKEFNTKLEEKFHEKEEQKKQLQSKTKFHRKPQERQSDQLKKLRRSLSFKLNPVPDFNHDASPPELESKKIPPTCAKSPKLGHRKSSIGIEPEDNRREHSVEHTCEDNTCKIPSKGNLVVKETMQNLSNRTPKTYTKRKYNSRNPITPKQEPLGMPETGYSHASAKNGNNGTSVLLHGSESPINEEKGLLEADGVKLKNNVESLNKQSIILESNSETAKSEIVIAIAETAELIENMQISVGCN